MPLLGCSYQWTGSKTADISEMVNAFNAAIAAKADGIACCLVDLKAFNGPTSNALRRRIPVARLQRRRRRPTDRLAYIGQDLYRLRLRDGQADRRAGRLGRRCAVHRDARPAEHPAAHRRCDGAIKKFSGGKIKTTAVATGAALPDELAKIDAYYLGHRNLKGMFAVDAGSTQAVGQTVVKYGLEKKGMKAGGYDLTPTTLKLIASGALDFTIDQQPYLQGWLPVLQLFFYRYSSGLVAPSNTNTGILFVTRGNVKPYLSTKTRYEGSSSAQKYPVHL